MSNLKDKLSANVRRVKATQAPEAPAADQPAAAKPAASRSAAAKSTVKSAVARTHTRKAPATAKPAAQQTQPKAPARSANFVEESGSTLFPARVWPD